MNEEFFRLRLAELRAQAEISARDLSLSLGQSESYINKIENGKAFPSMQMFFYICDYFSISPSDFFDEENRNPTLLRSLTKELKSLDRRHLEAIGLIGRMPEKDVEFLLGVVSSLHKKELLK